MLPYDFSNSTIPIDFSNSALYSKAEETQFGRCDASEYMVIGAPGSITENIAPKRGAANGTVCRIHSIQFHADHVELVNDQLSAVQGTFAVVVVPQPEFITGLVDGEYEVEIDGKPVTVSTSMFEDNLNTSVQIGTV
eukprot:g1691.t1